MTDALLSSHSTSGHPARFTLPRFVPGHNINHTLSPPRRFVLGHNPANWMLEVTAPGVEKSMGLDFAQLYRESPLNVKNQAQVDAECLPPPGTSPLVFDTVFSVSTTLQFKCVCACLGLQP